MELEKIPQPVFDIRGTEEVNKIKGEKHPVGKNFSPWLLPNGSPYFADPNQTVVYDQRGGELKLGRDYFLEEEFQPLVQVVGRKVCCFIRLSDAIIANNTFVTIDYRTVGAYFVPRTNLIDWLDRINKGQVGFDWNLVVDIPLTLPPCYHSHAIKTEIGDWFELTFFYVYLESLLRSKNANSGQELTDTLESVYAKLKETKETRLAALRAHDEDYNVPHKTNKADLVLGNHPNYKTATFAEDLAGLRSDVLSTPKGVSELAKTYEVDSDGAMLQGVIPISRFGGESFIPPNISGSFEGLGSISCAAGVCLENTGLVMFLANHFDGRVDGLYFSYMENYKKSPPDMKIIYSGFKYTPPSLSAIGVTPTRIVGGSGSKVIMVGIDGGSWHIALTNGTFDPSTHQYVTLDMTEVNKLFNNSPYTIAASQRATIHYMGDWLVLSQPYGGGVPENIALFRVKSSDVRLGNPVKWEKIKLTYKDCNDIQYTNADSLIIGDITKNANNEITKFGPWTYRQPPTSIGKNGKTATLSCLKSGEKGVNYFHVIANYGSFYNKPPANYAINTTNVMAYEFNPETGVMVTLAKPAQLSLGFTDTTQAERTKYSSDYYGQLVTLTSASGSSSGTLIETGELFCSWPNNGDLFPCYFQVIKHKGKDTIEDLLKGSLALQNVQVERDIRRGPIVPSPTTSGTYVGALSYLSDGELYTALDPADAGRKTYFRQVTGGYENRQGVTNLNVGTLLSRPLSNVAFVSNIDNQQGIVGVTGTAAELTSGKVECGDSNLSHCGWTSKSGTYLPVAPEFRAPAVNNAIVSFPRTISRTLDVPNKKITFKGETFYGFRQEIRDKLQSYVPTAALARSWCFEMAILGDEAGDMFKGLNIGVASIWWIDSATSTSRVQFLLFKPVVEAPNTDHPSMYLIKDLTILDAPPNQLCVKNIVDTAIFVVNPNWKLRPAFNVYRDGKALKVFSSASYVIGTNGTTVKMVSIFDINLTTNKLENVYSNEVGWNQQDLAVFIPKVGMTDVSLTGTTTEDKRISVVSPIPSTNTGGAGSLVKTTKGSVVTYYLLGSVYPATGWVVYLPENVQIIINGTSYKIQGGSLDLRDVDPSPQNKTFYIYATVVDDTPKYIFSGVKLRKSGKMMLVSVLVTNDKQILTISRLQPVMIGDYQISYERDGGIIPVSTGLPQDQGTFIFLKQSELLP